LDGKIDAVFADMDMPQRPGAALLVIDHDEIVCCKRYGPADLETQRPITADSSFYLASISKQVTALPGTLLACQQQAGFEHQPPAYFPRFPLWGAEIPLRHMLHHTSGLPEYFHLFSSGEQISEFTRSMTGVTNEAVLERIMDLAEPKFPVGAQYAYSNTGYVLLAMIVAIVSGQSFAHFLKTNIFDPLGLKHT